MSDLRALLERVEAATGPDRELDGDLWWTLCPDVSERVFWNGATGLPRPMDHAKPMPSGLGRGGVRAMAPKFTESVDAALSLIGRVLPGRDQDLLHDAMRAVGKAYALHARRWKADVDGDYRTALALALCAALLAAMVDASPLPTATPAA